MNRWTILLLAGVAACALTGCGFTANTLPAAPIPVTTPIPPPVPTPPPPAPAHNSWIWINGADIGDTPGVYGVQGVAAAANTPGGRASGASWTDTAGNFWLFGGSAVSSRAGETLLNDLWEYSGGQWKWVRGSSLPNQAGQYGTQGVAAAANVPGARAQTMSWTDLAGNFWLFGGIAFDQSGASVLLNDLWEYKAGAWTWVNGSALGGQTLPGVYGTRGVAGAGNVPGARLLAATWTDPNGTLWLFGGQGYDSTGTLGFLNDLWAYRGGEWTWMAGSNLVGQPGSYGTLGVASPTSSPGARYEAVGWTDATGALWLFGGAFQAPGQFNLENDLWRYSMDQWTWMGGSNQPNQPGAYGTLGVAASTNAPGSRAASIVWVDPSGTVWLFGGSGYGASGEADFLSDLWSYSAGQWIWKQGSNLGRQPGIYGTLGTPTFGALPGGRASGLSWVDASGKLWLFGGYGYDATAAISYMNDLWAYQP